MKDNMDYLKVEMKGDTHGSKSKIKCGMNNLKADKEGLKEG